MIPRELPGAGISIQRLLRACLLLACLSVKGLAFQGMYVNGFDSLCGNATLEANLLRTARALQFDAFTLYDLPKLEERHGRLADTNSRSFRCLEGFLRKARSAGITEIGAAVESMQGMHNRLEGYQARHSVLSPARLDAFVLEFEWWSPSLANPGGTYCNAYLLEQGIPCNTKGAWAWAARLMDSLRTIAHRNQAKAVVYASQFDPEQAAWIASRMDRVLLSNYIVNPEGKLGYLHVRNRIKTLATANETPELVILWSAEGGPGDPDDWLGNWLAGRFPWSLPHRLQSAHEQMLAAWRTADPTGPERSRLLGQQWFTWSDIQANALAYLAWISRFPPEGFSRWVDPLGRPRPNPVGTFQSRKALLLKEW